MITVLKRGPGRQSETPGRRKRDMNRRALSLAVCVGLILVLLASSVYIISEADHDCCGENCGICAHIAGAVALLKSMARLCVILPAVLAALHSARVFLHHSAAAKRCAPTLVRLKVRLDS